MSGFEAKWSPATPEVRVSYGPQDVDESRGGQASDSGTYKEAVYEFDFEQMHTEYGDGMGLELLYPPGSIITKVAIQSVTDAAAGSLKLDLAKSATTGDNVAVAAGTSVSTDEGGWVVATVLPAAITTDSAYEMLFSGLTAGRVKVVVTYLDSQNRPGR